MSRGQFRDLVLSGDRRRSSFSGSGIFPEVDNTFFFHLGKYSQNSGSNNKVRFDDDIFDRINYKYSALLLIMSIGLLTIRQNIGKPIQCWVPQEFTQSWEEYTENYCWVSNTYFHKLTEEASRMKRNSNNEIHYYQWIPVLLGLQSLLFSGPCFLWRWLSTRSGSRGLDLQKLLRLVYDGSNGLDDPQNQAFLPAPGNTGAPSGNPTAAAAASQPQTSFGGPGAVAQLAKMLHSVFMRHQYSQNLHYHQKTHSTRRQLKQHHYQRQQSQQSQQQQQQQQGKEDSNSIGSWCRCCSSCTSRRQSVAHHQQNQQQQQQLQQQLHNTSAQLPETSFPDDNQQHSRKHVDKKFSFLLTTATGNISVADTETTTEAGKAAASAATGRTRKLFGGADKYSNGCCCCCYRLLRYLKLWRISSNRYFNNEKRRQERRRRQHQSQKYKRHSYFQRCSIMSDVSYSSNSSLDSGNNIDGTAAVAARKKGMNHHESSMSTAYLGTKLIYLGNVLFQMYMMKKIIGNDNWLFGVTTLIDIIQKRHWLESGNFPRVSFCDIETKKLGKNQRYTIQCVLPMNMFVEKIYTFLWFWFVVLIILNLTAILLWVHRIYCAPVALVARYLELYGRAPLSRAPIRKFVHHFLVRDLLFIIYLIKINISDLVASSLVEQLWCIFYRQSDAKDLDDVKFCTNRGMGSRVPSLMINDELFSPNSDKEQQFMD